MPDGATISQASPVRVFDSLDEYSSVSNCPGGVYHHSAWGEAFAVYRQRVHWLVAERDGCVVGRLSLVHQSSRLFGEHLTSLPWVDEAGVAGPVEVIEALAEHARGLAKAVSPRCEVLLKQAVDGDAPNDRWAPAAGNKVLMRLKIARDSEQLWKALSAKVRNQVRKAEKSGLTTGRGGAELVKDFFEVYARNMRDLGSPSHSLKFFQKLVEGLGDLASVYCTRYEGVVVGGGIVLNNGASLDIPWASSRRDYNRMCVNHGMYWKILSDACEAGFEWFHFGRSSIGSGQYKFKKQWGAEEAPLNWWAYSPQGNDEPAETPAAVREKFGLAQRLWAKLPLWASKRLGPLIIRYVP